jgi:hypothetical protein
MKDNLSKFSMRVNCTLVRYRRKKKKYLFFNASQLYSCKIWMVVMVFNATFNNILAISWWSVVLLGGNRSTRTKPPTCRKSLTNFIT